MFNFNTQEVAADSKDYKDITRELKDAPMEVVKINYKSEGQAGTPTFSEQYDIRFKILKGNPATDEFAGCEFTTFAATAISEADPYKPADPQKKKNKEKMFGAMVVKIGQAAGVFDNDGNLLVALTGMDHFAAMATGVKVSGGVSYYVKGNGKIDNNAKNLRLMQAPAAAAAQAAPQFGQPAPAQAQPQQQQAANPFGQ